MFMYHINANWNRNSLMIREKITKCDDWSNIELYNHLPYTRVNIKPYLFRHKQVILMVIPQLTTI